MKVVAVNLLPQYNSLEEWRAYLQGFGAGEFVWAQDTSDGRAAQAYRIQSLGTTVIVARDGRIAYRDESASTYDMLRQGVLQALN